MEMICRIHLKRRGHSVTNQSYQELTNAMVDFYVRLKPLYLLASVLFPPLYLFLELICVSYLLRSSVHKDSKECPCFP